MNIIEYFQSLKDIIITSPFISSWEYQEDARTISEGFFKARVHFLDESLLEFREYINITEKRILKYSYSYHYQIDQKLIFRYDNTPHHQELSSFPHHKHLESDAVCECKEPTLEMIISEIENIIVLRV